jgi:hypothetical protein
MDLLQLVYEKHTLVLKVYHFVAETKVSTPVAGISGRDPCRESRSD